MIRQYQLFGERNSGTNYFDKVMSHNFPWLQKTTEFGHKHWFIKDLEPRGPSNSSTDNECRTSLEHERAKTTLFIYLIREPLAWLKAMHRKPYHAHNHKNISFGEFLRKSWRSFEFSKHDESGKNGRENWQKPVHEKEYTIETADNICQLRNQKNKHFLALGQTVSNFFVIRQHRLKRDLQRMAMQHSLRLKKLKLIDYRPPKQCEEIDLQDLLFIGSQLDANIEQELLGECDYNVHQKQ